MWEPSQPIDGRRSDRFRPPHCPYSECLEHRARPGRYRATRHGTYVRKRDPLRVNVRYRCPSCRRTFCRDAFAVSFRSKRPDLLTQVANMLISGSAHRQIARHVGCAHSTVSRMSVSLGRHAELFLERARSVLSVNEPIVFDHFETYVRAQPERIGVGTAVGQNTWFVYHLSGVEHVRLKGRSVKKRPLKNTPIPTKRGEYRRSTLETLEALLAMTPGELKLVTDDHPAYRSAVRHLTRRSAGRRIRHETHVSPGRSKTKRPGQARRRNRALFAVDLLHKIWRHSEAHHKRESFAFSRRRANVMARAALFAVWRNMIKRVTERRATRETPATRIGLTDRPWTWIDVFAKRIFERRIELESG